MTSGGEGLGIRDQEVDTITNRDEGPPRRSMEESRLGQLTGEFFLDKGLGPPLFIPAVMFLPLGIWVVSNAQRGPRFAVQLVVGLFFVTFAGLCLWAALRTRLLRRVIRVYERGFVFSSLDRMEIYRFDEIVEWTWSGERPYRLRVRGNDGRTLDLFTPSAMGCRVVADRLSTLGSPGANANHLDSPNGT